MCKYRMVAVAVRRIKKDIDKGGRISKRYAHKPKMQTHGGATLKERKAYTGQDTGIVAESTSKFTTAVIRQCYKTGAKNKIARRGIYAKVLENLAQ